MRFLYGFIAWIIWMIFLGAFHNYGCDVSDNMQILTMAIVIAGALAGGDGT